MKKFLLSISAVAMCMTASAALTIPALTDQFNSQVSAVQETPDYSNPVAYDASNNLIVTGSFSEDFTFKGATLEAIGSSAYILKYNNEGVEQWGVALTGAATITAIDTDADGNIYVAGTLADEVSFGTTSGEAIVREGLKIDGAPTTQQSASFIAKYDKDGKVAAVKTFVPESLPALEATGMYDPTGEDLYFAIEGLKVDGAKVYATAKFTGHTAVGNGYLDGAYANLYDMIYFDAQNLGVLSLDCATMESAEIEAAISIEGPYNDSTPSLSSPAMDVKNGQVVVGFLLTTTGYDNDINIELGSYSTKIKPTSQVVDYVVVKEGAVSSMKKAATEAFISYDGLGDIVISGDNVYVIGSYDTDKPAAALASEAVAPAGKSDIFVGTLSLSDLSVKQVDGNNVNEGDDAGYEMVGSTAIVDGVLYINTVTSKGVGGSYWFDGAAFSDAPVAATGVAAGNGVLALASSNATSMDVKTYSFVYTGISGIEADFDENAPVEYYNLQGIRVANPENGLYIRRQGNKVEKVIL